MRILKLGLLSFFSLIAFVSIMVACSKDSNVSSINKNEDVLDEKVGFKDQH
ncbi:MAG TPA: hypothetical protein VNM45_17730 [Bacillus sp. (in: firmicutes)]|nr:hypothetical protein [Bacillus sp. (in: firmicutes)]